MKDPRRRVLLASLIGLASLTALLPPSARASEKETGAAYRPPEPLERVEYLVVTGRHLCEAFEPLADWKRSQGVPADVVAVEDVLDNPRYRGADGPETLRNFLKDLFWKWGLAYVLLGADVNIVPTRFIRLIERQACDAYFACLEGDWNEDGDAWFGSASDRVVQQADLFVGRVPAETPAEVHAFLKKYFAYVRPEHTDYQDRVLLVGAVLGDDHHWDADDHYAHLARTYLEPAGLDVVHLEQTERLRGRFVRDPDTKKCSGFLFGPPNGRDGLADRKRTLQEINRGFGFVSHYAHSNTYLMGLPGGGIRNSDVDRIANAARPSVFFSSGCHVNQFDQESVSEALLLHEGGGAVAFIGCTVNSFAYQNLYERDFFEALLDFGETRIGRALEASKIRRSASNVAGKNPLTVLNRGLSLLGDPHMRVWTGSPRPLSVSVTPPAPGEADIEIRVQDDRGNAVEGAVAALWKKGAYLARARTGSDGRAVLPAPRRGFETVRLTATAPGFLPRSQAIRLAPGPKVRPLEVSLTAGRDDRLDAGETAEILVAVLNEGDTPVSGLRGRLWTEDPYLKAEPLDVAYGDLEPGDASVPDRGFAFAVDADAPPHHVASVRFRLESEGRVLWEGPLRMPLHRPVLRLAGQRLLRAGRETPGPLFGDDAGRDASLVVEIANHGTGEARNLTARLLSPVEGVTVTDPERRIETVAPGARCAIDPPFALAVDPSFEGGPAEFILRLVPGDGAPEEEVFAVREPPEVPGGLSAKAGTSSVLLTWEPVETPRLGGYLVFRAPEGETAFVRVTPSPVRSSRFEDRGLASQATYGYRVVAVDRDRNRSRPSLPVWVATTHPLLQDWPKKAGGGLMHVTVADVDGDGDLEIATGDDKGGVWIWHHTGQELIHGGDPWTFGLFKDLPHGALAPTLADLDGDGKREILTAGTFKDRKVYAFDAEGEALPGWPKTAKGRLMTPPQCADLDGDGNVEIVFHEGFGKNLYVWRRDGTAFHWEKKKGKPVPREIVAKTDPFTYFVSTLVDVDGDGVLDIAGLGGRGSLYAVRPDGTPLEGFPVTYGKVLGSTAPAGDVDGDGKPELVFVSDGGTALHAVRADGREVLGFPRTIWKEKPKEGRSFPLLADLDGEQGLEIVVGGRDGQLFAVSGEGKDLPGFPVRLPKEATGSAAGDVDGDGAVDVVCACMDGNVYAFAADGRPLRGFPLDTGGPVRGCPAIADVDRDGDVEVLAASADGYVYIWDLATQYDPGRIAWPMYGGNPERTGCPVAPPLPPRELRVRGEEASRLTWRAPRTPPGMRIAGYHVWRRREGVFRKITGAPVEGTRYRDEEVVPGVGYAYAVSAVAPGGRESALTQPVAWGEEAVTKLFEEALRDEERRRYRAAIRKLEDLLERFPASRFAEKAREKRKALQADTGVQRALEKKKIESWCKGMLGLARTWIKSDRPEKARECLQNVVEKHPETQWAEEAKKALEKLEGR